MAVTITRAGDSATTEPTTLLLPDDVTDESRNIETDLLDGSMAVTLIAPRPGTGTMTLVYPDETAARAGRALHRARDYFTLVDTDNDARGMTYALAQGGTRLGRHSSDPDLWVLAVNYRELDL
jgi:hypothetical protein